MTNRPTSPRNPHLGRVNLPGIFSQLDQALGFIDPSSMATCAWVPRVDIRETPEAFLIQADLPGVDPDAIEIHMDKGVLTIKGERSVAQPDVSEGVFGMRLERQCGTFHRRFGLPDSANAENIQASSKNGVLEVSIPKQPETKPRRIHVRAPESQDKGESTE